MNSAVHHPQQLIESSWRILEHVRTPSPPSLYRADLSQTTSPSLREILAAFKFSKGQDGDCQLLLAVLNAKSAEDQVICPPIRVVGSSNSPPFVVQRTAAIANLHARLLESQPDKHYTTPPPTYSIPRLHIPSPVSPPRSHSPFSPTAQHSDSSYEPSRSHRQTLSPRPTKKYRRSPYERPTQVADSDTHPWGPKYSYESHRSPCSSNGSDTSSPRSREAMSIGTLLSTQNSQLDDDERGVSSERSTSRKVSP